VLDNSILIVYAADYAQLGSKERLGKAHQKIKNERVRENSTVKPLASSIASTLRHNIWDLKKKLQPVITQIIKTTKTSYKISVAGNSKHYELEVS
jgi:hypothetical protein